MFWNQIADYWCPDMNSNKKNHTTFIIQNESVNNTNNASYDLFFVLDTCEHLSTLTHQECNTETESQAVIEKMIVDTKI